jgi:protein HOOK3
MLKSLLDDSQKAREKLEKDYLQSHGEKLILESQLTALKSGVSVEGSEVLLKLRESVVSNDAEISKLRKQVAELEADLSVTKRALITAQSDCKLQRLMIQRLVADNPQ